MSPEHLSLLNALEKITKTMDVPSFKLRNVGWLAKNMAARNRQHPEFQKAQEIIKTLLSHGITQG